MLKGKYTPFNTHKYKGDHTNIIYRSSYELKFMKWCDHTDAVLEWSSEEFCIRYKNPLDGKFHRYFPDFKIKVQTNNGIETWVIEIKPMSQVKEPQIQTKKTKRYINEVKTYAVNTYKWKYAEEWCKDRNYKFVILTEKELGIKK